MKKNTFEQLKTKALNNHPHLTNVPQVYVNIYQSLVTKFQEINLKQELINRLQTEILAKQAKINELETKIYQLENHDRDTMNLLQTANNERNSIAAQRDLLQTEVRNLTTKITQLELNLKLIEDELNQLRTKKTNLKNTSDTNKRNFEDRIRDLERQKLTDNEKKVNDLINNIHQQIKFDSSSNITGIIIPRTNLFRSDISWIKDQLNSLNTCQLTNNPNLGNLPSEVYQGLINLVRNQQEIWKKEDWAKKKIAELTDQTNLEIGVKNQLLERLRPITFKQGSWVDFYGWLRREIVDINEKGTGKWNIRTDKRNIYQTDSTTVTDRISILMNALEERLGFPLINYSDQGIWEGNKDNYFMKLLNYDLSASFQELIDYRNSGKITATGDLYYYRIQASYFREKQNQLRLEGRSTLNYEWVSVQNSINHWSSLGLNYGNCFPLAITLFQEYKKRLHEEAQVATYLDLGQFTIQSENLLLSFSYFLIRYGDWNMTNKLSLINSDNYPLSQSITTYLFFINNRAIKYLRRMMNEKKPIRIKVDPGFLPGCSSSTLELNYELKIKGGYAIDDMVILPNTLNKYKLKVDNTLRKNWTDFYDWLLVNKINDDWSVKIPDSRLSNNLLVEFMESLNYNVKFERGEENLSMRLFTCFDRNWSFADYFDKDNVYQWSSNDFIQTKSGGTTYDIIESWFNEWKLTL